jgi:hypothetical protein
MYANSHPVRTKFSFESAVQAAGLDFDDVTDDWLRSLDDGWVYGLNESPFASEETNRHYRELMKRFGQRPF